MSVALNWEPAVVCGRMIAFHTSETKQRKKKKRKENGKEKTKKQRKGVRRTWEPAVVCGRMRKASFHVCWSQVGTVTCDM